MEFEQREILPQSEQQFRQRVRDLEAAAHANAMAARRMIKLAEAMAADNARLRRAVRTLAKLQPERVRRAVMEGMNDAR
jgi:hypothetical protein